MLSKLYPIHVVLLSSILACATLTVLNSFKAFASLKNNQQYSKQYSNMSFNSADLRIYGFHKNYHKPYIVDEYEVQMQWTDNLEIDGDCIFFAPSFQEDSQIREERQKNCNIRRRIALNNIVLPASIGESPRDFFSQRYQYLGDDLRLEYPAQDFVLLTGFTHLSSAIEVVEILRQDSIWEVNIEEKGDYSEMAGTIIKVDLGYLEPNNYSVIIKWLTYTDDGTIRSWREVVDFRVYDEDANE